jgi:hypothetical protein
MQTFMPYSDFTLSLNCLDYKRLGKQRVETKQLLNALAGLTKGWVNHPAAKMWRGHEAALARYGAISSRLWLERGYKDSLLPFFEEQEKLWAEKTGIDKPPWMGDERVHASHRSNLLRKDKVFYGAYGWTEPDTLPYLWPVLTDYGYRLSEI